LTFLEEEVHFPVVCTTDICTGLLRGTTIFSEMCQNFLKFSKPDGSVCEHDLTIQTQPVNKIPLPPCSYWIAVVHLYKTN